MDKQVKSLQKEINSLQRGLPSARRLTPLQQLAFDGQLGS